MYIYILQVYIYTCKYIYLCVYIYLYIYIYKYMYVCVYVGYIERIVCKSLPLCKFYLAKYHHVYTSMYINIHAKYHHVYTLIYIDIHDI
jgi:hypothetical protein